MPLRAASLDLPTLDATPTDAYVVFVASDERPLSGLGAWLDWRLSGKLSQRLLGGGWSGDRGEQVLMTVGDALPGPRLFAFGMGPLAKVDAERFADVAQTSAQVLQDAGIRRLVVGLPERPAMPEAVRLLTKAFASRRELDVLLVGPVKELQPLLSESAPAR